MTPEQAYDIAGKAVAVHIAKQEARQAHTDTAMMKYTQALNDLNDAIQALPEDAFTRVK